MSKGDPAGSGGGPGHAHAHRRPAAPDERREDLPPGAGAGKTLLLDTFSGVAGDMTVAALIDLGVPLQVVSDAVQALGLDGVRPVVHARRAGAIGALGFEVLVETQQPERTYQQIDELLRAAPLAATVAELARRIFRRLGEAEAAVHRVPLADVHFHEVGAADAIVDIVGAAACFSYLAAEVVSTPLPMGRGSVDSRHGRLPLPAPATVACLQGVPTYDAGIDAELVTPTGAAIVATLAREFLRWPSFAPERIGWGSGSRSLAGLPNALRAVLGEPHAEPAQPAASSHVVIEANVDDLTGELAAHAISALLAAGALDAWAEPTTMKKGRPGVVLHVLAREADCRRLAELIFQETSTFGLRLTPVARMHAEERVETVLVQGEPVGVRLGYVGGRLVTISPEYEDVRRLATATDRPAGAVYELARALARDAFDAEQRPPAMS